MKHILFVSFVLSVPLLAASKPDIQDSCDLLSKHLMQQDERKVLQH